MTRHRPSTLRDDVCCLLGPTNRCHRGKTIDCCSILGENRAISKGYTCQQPIPDIPNSEPIPDIPSSGDDGLGIPATSLEQEEEEIVFEIEDESTANDEDDDEFMAHNEQEKLILPPITQKLIVNKCNDKCKQLKINIKKECNILRKRVALALKQKGCPTKITAYKKRKKPNKITK